MMDTALKAETLERLVPAWRGGACRELTEEYVVPDSMPDVAELMDAEGLLTVSGKDTETGAVLLTGNLALWAVYLPEGEGGLRSMELSIPVSIRLDAPGADADCRCVARMRVQSVEARAVNSRKISVRAEVEAEAVCWRSDPISLPVGFADDGAGVYVRGAEAEVMPVCDVRERTFALTDEYAMPGGLGSGARILSRRTEAAAEEVKCVGGKVLIRGRLRSDILFADDAEKTASGRYETEFSQLMDLELPEGAEALPEVTLFITGAYYDLPEPGQDGSRLRAELHLGAQCVCRRKVRIAWMTDLYSNRACLVPETQTLRLASSVRPVVLRQTVADRIELPDREAELTRATACVSSVTEEEGCIRAVVQVRLLLAGRDGARSCARGRLSAEFTMPEGDAAESLRDVCVTVTDLYAVPGTGDVRVSLRLDGFAERRASLCVVTSVREDEQSVSRERAPSAVLVRVPEGADLWELAKRLHSSEEEILRVNESRRDGLLLVPKTR